MLLLLCSRDWGSGIDKETTLGGTATVRAINPKCHPVRIYSVFRATPVSSEWLIWIVVGEQEHPITYLAWISMAKQHGCLKHLCGINVANQ